MLFCTREEAAYFSARALSGALTLTQVGWREDLAASLDNSGAALASTCGTASWLPMTAADCGRCLGYCRVKRRGRAGRAFSQAWL